MKHVAPVAPAITPEAVAAMRGHPAFSAACRRAMESFVLLYQRGKLMNWILSDRARALLGHMLVYLHVTTTPNDPRSGLTASRLKSLCEETKLCSRGRAGAMLALMRVAGHVTAASAPEDRRVHRLMPTEKLLDMQRTRLRAHFQAIALIRPAVGAAARRLGEPQFEHAFVVALGRRYLAGERILACCPRLATFSERSAAMVILFSLMLGGEGDNPFSADAAVPAAIAPLARRFGVSRAHILRLLREAERTELLSRRHDATVQLRPALTGEMANMFAAMFLLVGTSAEEALRGS